MALYDERDMQSQRRWHSRLTKERFNLSESVDAALADTESQEQWYEDEQESPARSTSNTALIPPRLSLQSKMQPAVRSGGFVQSATAQMEAEKNVEEQKLQHTGILARLAQRFTSSLAAFGSSMQPGASSVLPSPVMYHEVSQPYDGAQLVNIAQAHAIMSIERVDTPSATVIDAIPATPSTAPPHPVQSKERLAGHTAKIRLHNAADSKTMPLSKDREAREVREPLYDLVREPVVVNVRVREKTQETTRPDLPAVMTPRQEVKVANNLVAEEPRGNNAAIGYEAFFGTSAFESGQGEVMITNTQVVASSVVQVTLTSNPGQTLVQYVSLYPEIGFTIHLTAPAVTKTTFNYVILSKLSES